MNNDDRIIELLENISLKLDKIQENTSDNWYMRSIDTQTSDTSSKLDEVITEIKKIKNK
jgi:hypothetical protein